ncbi:MAG: hypothetical protein NPIRA04_02690 [Nitrospirales bacterium]|nr:MAG: hypothetical protein NPIRA04_02690 [Nitrospirales bacterium]
MRLPQGWGCFVSPQAGSQVVVSSQNSPKKIRTEKNSAKQQASYTGIRKDLCDHMFMVHDQLMVLTKTW